MSVHGMQGCDARDGNRPAPEYLAHWVVKTARSDAVIAWYGMLFGAHVVHVDSKIALLTWDEESRRLALGKIPGSRYPPRRQSAPCTDVEDALRWHT
jgi:hypothetical protein